MISFLCRIPKHKVNITLVPQALNGSVIVLPKRILMLRRKKVIQKLLIVQVYYSQQTQRSTSRDSLVFITLFTTVIGRDL